MSYISIFSRQLRFTCFCQIVNFSSILFAFPVSMSSLQQPSCLNIYYERFYFILVWRVLEFLKLENCFCLPTSNRFAIQNNELMQFCLNFHKTLIRLGSFSGIKKTVEGRKGKFIFFLSLLLSVHINFENKLKYHTSPFIAIFYLFCSIPLIIFFNLQFHWLFSLICYYRFNQYV